VEKNRGPGACAAGIGGRKFPTRGEKGERKKIESKKNRGKTQPLPPRCGHAKNRKNRVNGMGTTRTLRKEGDPKTPPLESGPPKWIPLSHPWGRIMALRKKEPKPKQSQDLRQKRVWVTGAKITPHDLAQEAAFEKGVRKKHNPKKRQSIQDP